MEPAKQMEQEGLQAEHDNEFLPKDPNSYLSMEIDHNERRSLMLANDHFFPQNQSSQQKEAGNPGEPDIESELSPEALESRKEGDDPEGCSHEDEENQFMMGHNSFGGSMNQGLIHNQSLPEIQTESNDKIMMVNKEQNSFPPAQTSHQKEEDPFGGNLESNVEAYVDPKLPEEKQPDNSSHVFPQVNQSSLKSQKMEGSSKIKAEQISEHQHQLMGLQGESHHQEQNQFLSLGRPEQEQQKQFLMNQSNESFAKKPQSSLEHPEEGLPFELPEEECQVQSKHNSEKNQYPQLQPEQDRSGKLNTSDPLASIQSHGLKQKSEVIEEANIAPEASRIESNRYNTQQLIESGPVIQEPESSLHQAKSSIIKRIVIDDSPSRGTIQGQVPSSKKFELKLEPSSQIKEPNAMEEERTDPEEKESSQEEKGLIESQVVKYQRKEEEFHEAFQKAPKPETERESLEDIQLNENESRFLQPIEQSMRSVKSFHNVVQVDSQAQELKEPSHNLSNMILDPLPADSGQNSENINLESSVREKKAENSSVFGKNSSRYEESLSEFRQEQVRRMQERSSIEHLQSNITDGGSEIILQEAHYQIGKNEDQMETSALKKQTEVHEQQELKSKEEQDGQEEEQDGEKEQFEASRENKTEHQDPSGKILQQSDATVKENSQQSPKNGREKEKEQIPHSQIRRNKNDAIQISPQESFSHKQEMNTANIVTSNNDLASADTVGPDISLKDSNFTKKVNTLADIPQTQEADPYLSHGKPTIFNTYPQEPKPQEFNEFQQNREEYEDSQKKLTRTPQEKVKFDRLHRDKIMSNKDAYPLTSKKKERLSKHQDNDDQIQRMRIIKQAHKRRLERQLEKVEKEIEEINIKEKRMERIYQESEKTETEERTPKGSSHQSRHRRESEQLRKMVKEHRRIKEQEQLEFQDIDRHITNNLMELNKMRQEAEDKKKEKKRLEIMERMKKNQLRKINEQKQMKANNHYVQQFKAEGGPQIPKSPPRQSLLANPSENIFKKKRPSEQEPTQLDVVSHHIKEHPRPRVTKIKSLNRKVELDKYENRLG